MREGESFTVAGALPLVHGFLVASCVLRAPTLGSTRNITNCVYTKIRIYSSITNIPLRGGESFPVTGWPAGGTFATLPTVPEIKFKLTEAQNNLWQEMSPW